MNFNFLFDYLIVTFIHEYYTVGNYSVTSRENFLKLEIINKYVNIYKYESLDIKCVNM